MFGKLKNFAAASMIQGMIKKIDPIIDQHFEKIKTLTPEQVYDNESFDRLIGRPAWDDISAHLGGFAQMYPAMDEKFLAVMRHVRDEIVTVNDGKVDLVENHMNKLSDIVMASLNKEL